jgi:nucleoside-diphosphate-sugar epimerase
MNGRVLITGASGFVGYHLIQAALKNKLEVAAAVRKTSDIRHLQSLPITFIDPAYSDRMKLAGQLKDGGFNYVIHAAGSTKARTLDDYSHTNVALTATLAHASLESGIPLKRFIFLSSLAAVGPNTEGAIAAGEERPCTPVTSYGLSKLHAEQYLSTHAGELPLITLRPTAVYGPRERDLFMIIRLIAKGLEPYIGRDPQQLSFVYVKDLAEVTIRSLTAEVPSHSTYNISDGATYDRYTFASIIKEALGRKTVKLHIPTGLVRMIARFNDRTFLSSKNPPALNTEKLNELTASNWACRIDKARCELGYLPQYDLRSGLAETIAWYKKNHWLN